jgi:hypothetical protein
MLPVTWCRIEPLSDKAFWNRVLERPIKHGDPRGLPRLRALMASCAMRRTKETRINGKNIVDLPRKTISLQVSWLRQSSFKVELQSESSLETDCVLQA